MLIMLLIVCSEQFLSCSADSQLPSPASLSSLLLPMFPPVLLLLLLELTQSAQEVREVREVREDCEEVWLELESECREVEVVECEAECETEPVTRRDCQIVMRKVWSPVLVSDCSPPAGGERGRCEGGVERRCKVRMTTSCRNTLKYTTIEEDQPVCTTEIIEQVKVNRCRVVKRRRRKMLPQTVCSRVPRHGGIFNQ